MLEDSALSSKRLVERTLLKPDCRFDSISTPEALAAEAFAGRPAQIYNKVVNDQIEAMQDIICRKYAKNLSFATWTSIKKTSLLNNRKVKSDDKFVYVIYR